MLAAYSSSNALLILAGKLKMQVVALFMLKIFTRSLAITLCSLLMLYIKIKVVVRTDD